MINIRSLYELKHLDAKNYSRVKVVELDKLDLQEIPEKIYQLVNLKILILSSNLITKVSAKISNLQKIEELYLNRNRITELPEEIGKLENLKKLIISNNEIKTLPNSFYNLKNLEILNIVSNKLEFISDSIINMDKLEYLYLRSNKLKYISKEIKKIKVVGIYPDSYENMNNLAENCEYLQITNLKEPLNNLPMGIKEIRLFLPTRVDIKLPFDCKLYIDDILHL